MTGPGTTGPGTTGITVRARDVLGSEWTKFCSVRSTFWTLLVAVLTPVGISALIAVALASSPGQGADQGDALMPGLFSMEYAVLAGHHLSVSLSRPGVPGAVLADGLLLFVVAMMGVGLGAIVRHTAGGIAALVGPIFLPSIAGVLPAPWGSRIGQFTLLDAARQVTALHPEANLFAPAWSLPVLLAWPAATLLAAAVLITRRDA